MEYIFTYSISLMQQENFNFLGCSEKSNFKQKMSTTVIEKKIKSLSKEYVRNALEILINEKHFPKIISHWRVLFYLTSLDKISFTRCNLSKQAGIGYNKVKSVEESRKKETLIENCYFFLM